MSSLFDAIKGAMVLLGGAREGRLEEDKIRSEIEHRKNLESIEREKLSLQKELTEGGWKQQTKLQESAQTFQMSESDLLRKHGKEILNLQIAANAALEAQRQTGESARNTESLAMKLKIAQMQDALGREGLKLEGEKLAKTMTVEQLKLVVEAYKIASTAVTGIGGLYSSMTNPAARAYLQQQEDQIFQTVLGLVDSDGKLGLKGLTLKGVISNIDPKNPTVSWDWGAPPPKGVVLDQTAITPTKPTGGLPSLPGEPTSKAPASTMPALDKTAKTPMSMTIDPGDLFALQSVAAHIGTTPEPDVALQEYQSILNDPSYTTFGTSKYPDQNAYRQLLQSELKNLVTTNRSKASNPYAITGR